MTALEEYAPEPVPLSSYEADEVGAAGRPQDASAGTGLRFEDVADVMARVKAKPPRKWLARGVIVSGAHVATVAEDTVGKGFAMTDLAVNTATGGKWLGKFECDDPGPVTVLVGEDDEDETIRRGHAVASFYGHDIGTLPIRYCFRVPRLTEDAQLQALRLELDRHPPKLVILDPLYLALGGKVQTSQLAEMGGVLGPLQYACRDVGATLMVVHHWNKTGAGTSRHRATGAGIPEWARMTASVSVKSRATRDAATIVRQRWEFIGNGIVDTTLEVQRTVWADDPTDLSSPLHYELHQVEDTDRPDDDLTPAQRRTLVALTALVGPVTVKEIGDIVAHDDSGGPPLKTRTIQEALRHLGGLDLAHDDDPGPGCTAHWTAGPRPVRDTP